MAVGPLSRYAREAVYEMPLENGQRATVAARWERTVPPDVAWHVIVEGESYETLAARYLGSSTLWWRIADANPLIFPLDIAPGTTVAVPIGGSRTSNLRRRSWSHG